MWIGASCQSNRTESSLIAEDRVVGDTEKQVKWLLNRGPQNVDEMWKCWIDIRRRLAEKKNEEEEQSLADKGIAAAKVGRQVVRRRRMQLTLLLNVGCS